MAIKPRVFIEMAIAAALMVGLSLPSAGQRPSGGDPGAMFLKEAPTAWEKLRQFCDHTQSEVEESTHNSVDKDGANDEKVHIYYKREDKSFVYSWNCDKGRFAGREYVFALNPDYGFIVQKNSGSEARQIRYVGEDRSAVYRRAESPGYMYYPLMLFLSATIDKIAKSPDFRLLKAAPLKMAGRDLIKVEFESQYRVQRGVVLDGGWATLDPNHFWSVQEFELSLNDGQQKVHGVTEYGEPVSGFPSPRGGSLTLANTKDGDATEYQFQYRDFGIGSVPSEACRRTAYGFPEPGLAKSNSTRWFVAGNLVAIPGLIGLSLLFRKRARAQSEA